MLLIYLLIKTHYTHANVLGLKLNIQHITAVRHAVLMLLSNIYFTELHSTFWRKKRLLFYWPRDKRHCCIINNYSQLHFARITRICTLEFLTICQFRGFCLWLVNNHRTWCPIGWNCMSVHHYLSLSAKVVSHKANLETVSGSNGIFWPLKLDKSAFQKNSAFQHNPLGMEWQPLLSLNTFCWVLFMIILSQFKEYNFEPGVEFSE